MLLLLGGVGPAVAALKLLHRSSWGCGAAAVVFCSCCGLEVRLLLLVEVMEGLLLLVMGGGGVVLLLPLSLGLGDGLIAGPTCT
jgi:hypothetical protein